MTKLQASMKESSSRRQSLMLARVAYKVGSYFKSCENCCEIELVEMGNHFVKRYKGNYAVYRSYSPKVTGYTYWCFCCGAKDERCWDGANDIGTDAIRGTREAIAKRKSFLRKEALKFNAKADPAKVIAASPLAPEIAALEAEVRRLEEMLRGIR